MKRLIRLTAMFLLLTILITGLAQSADVSSGAQMRGVWVSTAYQIDYPTQGTSEKQLKKQCTDILDEVQACGLNTVFLQVRPMADAFYPSDLFPWSVYLTGKVGKSPGFDPLSYWIEQAHQRGLKLHAWINPYRISKGAEAEQMFQNLPDSHPAKQHPDWVVKYDGGYYFNPGIPEVRELICAGVQEIVSGYDVDGIQFDDYFYPAPDFDDDDTYRKYGKDFSSVYDWRRDNVNQLVQSVKAITDTKSGCDFGISPSGIWRNRTSDVRGSDTQGYESYSQCYADAVTWIESGWLDYICPQIYWNIGFDAADYRTLAKWWAQTVKGSDTKLYIGMAAYKAGGVDAQTDYAAPCARAVVSGEMDRGIVICGTGIGISIAANKIKGVRCALCTDPVMARLTREHNDANMLAMGARIIGGELARGIVKAFLETDFSNGKRHMDRINKITELERAK